MPIVDLDPIPTLARTGSAELRDPAKSTPVADFNAPMVDFGFHSRNEQPIRPMGETSILGSAFRQDNIIGSALNQQDLGIANERDPLEPNYSAWPEIKGTRYEEHWKRFVDANNRRFSDGIKRQIDMESDDRRTLDASGWRGTLASMVMGTIDPTILFPGGQAVRAIKGGYSISRSALSIGLAAGVGTVAQESLLQATQEARPLEDSAIAVGGSFILGSLLGGGAAMLLNRAERKAVESAARVLYGDNSNAEAAAVPTGSGSPLGGSATGAAAGGADVVTRPTLDDLTISGGIAEAAANATKITNPNLRSNFRAAASAREVSQQLAENSLYQGMHDEGRSLGASVETMARVNYNARIFQSVDENNIIFKEARKSGMSLSRTEFEEAVGRALRNGDVGENEFVTKAAEAWRRNIFDPFKDEAIAAWLLPPDVTPEGANSYFTRVYNREMLTAREADFKGRVSSYYSGVLAREFESHAEATRARIAQLESELADLRLNPDDRATTIGDINAKLRTLESDNIDKIDLVDRIAALNKAAKDATQNGDRAAATIAREEAGRLKQEGGKDLAGFIKERSALRARSRRVEMNYAGLEARQNKVLQQLNDLEQSNIRNMNRLVARGRRFEQEAQKLDPALRDAKMAELRSDFAQVLKRSEDAAQRIADARAKLASEANENADSAATKNVLPTGEGGATQPSLSKADDVIEAVRSSFGKDGDALIQDGYVKVVQTTRDLPARPDGLAHPDDAKGMFDGKTAYLVADNMVPSEAKAVILHEVGVHSGMRGMLGDDVFARLLADVDAKVRAGDEAFVAARAAVPQDTPKAHIAEETLAYLVENAPEIPLVQELISKVRQWVYRLTGGRFVSLDENDIRSMAVSALRSARPDQGRSSNPLYARKTTNLVRPMEELLAGAKEASSWADWYDRYQDDLRRLFGSDADIFQKMLSATSQANNVRGNVTLALKAYRQFLEGKPFEGYLPDVIKNLDRVRNEEALRGQKIAEYGKANEGDADGIAVDRHIAELFFDTKSPNATQVQAAKGVIRSIAGDLGWKPRDVQAALWAYNQIRKGVEPQSYDTYLKAKTDQIDQLRAEFGRGEARGLQEGGPNGSDTPTEEGRAIGNGGSVQQSAAAEDPVALYSRRKKQTGNEIKAAEEAVQATGRRVVAADELDALIASNRVPKITLQDLVGKKVFGTIADRTAAAVVYTGIDGSKLDVAIPMLGGPRFPLRESNVNAGVVWANRGDSVTSQKTAKLKEGADYMMVVLGDANMHQSNTTVSNAYFSTFHAYQRDGRISPDNAAKITEIVRSASGENEQIRKALREFPGFGDDKVLDDYVHGMSFEARKRLLDVLGGKNVQNYGAPNFAKILDATRDPAYAGNRWGDGVLVVRVDQDRPLVDLGTEGTTPHPDFPLGIRGELVGVLDTPINYRTLWRDYMGQQDAKLAEWLALPAGERPGKMAPNPRRSFELSKPVVEVTQDLVDSIGKYEAPGVDSPRQARLAVDMAGNRWKTSDASVKQGGVSPQEFLDAIDKSDAHATLSTFDLSPLKKDIKSGRMRLYQLGDDGQIYFALKRGDPGYESDYGFKHPDIGADEVTLTSVVNNEQGARGVGGPAVVLKALEEGATVLDAFAVKTTRYPDGFLPHLYGQFGFEKLGEIPFDPRYYDPLKLADAEAFWAKSGWTKDRDGYPPLVIMKWRGTDADRAGITGRYARDGVESLFTGRDTRDASATYDGLLADAGKAPEGGQAAADAGRAGGPQGDGNSASVASRAQSVIRNIAGLTDEAARNLGLSRADIELIRAALSSRAASVVDPAGGVKYSRSGGSDQPALDRMLERNEKAEANRIEKLNKLARRMDALDAFNPEERMFELRRIVDELAQEVSNSSLVKGEKAAALKARYEQFSPDRIAAREAEIARMKAEVERAFYTRWETKAMGEGVDLGRGARPAFDELAKQIADDVFDKITGRSNAGVSAPEFITPLTSGPLKERTFNVPDKLIEDFLEHNVVSVAERYGRSMAAQIEMTKKFGRADMADQIRAVTDEYRDLRKAVAATTTGEEAAAVVGRKPGALDGFRAWSRGNSADQVTKESILKWLDADEKGAVEDIEAMRDLVLGRYKLSENSGDYGRLVRSMNAFNYIRSMGGAVLANITELYRPAMVHGLRSYMQDGVAPLLTNMEAVKLSVREARLAGLATEAVVHGRLSTMAEIGDPYKSGSAIEKFLQNGTRLANKWNGLALWTDMMKSVSSILSQHRIIDGVLGKSNDVRFLAYLGIDKGMAGRIAEQFTQFGKTINGVHVAGTEAWADKEAVRAYRAALAKDVNSIIVERSVGDVPLFANTPTGKLLLQFRTFNMAANQKVMLRGMQESQARFVSGVVAMTTIGMLAATLRSWRGGEERWQKFKASASNPGYLIGEGLDLAGIFTLPFELANTAEKFAQGAGKDFNAIKSPLMAAFPNASQAGESTRFSSRGVIGGIAGPSAGMVENAAKALGGSANAASQFIPFGSYAGMREAVQLLTGNSPYGR